MLIALPLCLAGADLALTPRDAVPANAGTSAETIGTMDVADMADDAAPVLPTLTNEAERNGPNHAVERVSVGKAIGAVKWETLALAGYLGTINSVKLINNAGRFDFQSEGWFSKSSNTVGIDKLTHAFNTYLITDMLQDRMERKIGNQTSARLAAGAIAGSLMLLTEVADGFEDTSGFSLEDITMNTVGSGFSILRRSIPGLRDKLDYRMMVVPNSEIYTFKGRRHFRQLRFLFSLQLAGFEKLKPTPWRFVELHAGYYASGFTAQEQARGDAVRRHVFVGVGLNVGQLLFGRSPSSRAAKIGQGTLRYLQLPYTAVHPKF